MKVEQPWILLGMMGSGKTTIGKLLAEKTGRPFIDTDVLISQRLGRSIENIFEFYGEPTFREHETSILRSLRPLPSVISTGGGAVVKAENREIFKTLGKTIYLDVPVQTLIARLSVSKKKRPLLNHEDWELRLEKLLQDRIPFYEMADITVQLADATLESAAEIVRERIQNG